ncbi:hypothetical protein DV735_g3628, partial [Chaetothyriales sp. CBS 134920]
MTAILYPSGLPTFNYQDTVLVSYNTPWPATNLTVSCQDGEQGTVSYDDDSLPAGGVVSLSPIEGTLNLSEFPAQCHILLTDTTDSEQWINDGVFTLTSTIGAVTTYGASSTGQAPTTTTINAQPTNIISLESMPLSSDTNAGTLSATLTNDGAVSPTTSDTATTSSSFLPSSVRSTTTSSSSTAPSSLPSLPATSSDSGLSSGAKAGLAIGIVLIFAVLVLAAFLCYRRRRNNSTQSPSAAESGLANERAGQRAPQPPYIDSMAKRSKSSENTGPERAILRRKILSAEDMRQSGDWKQFFSAKAASAAGSLGGAAAAVGSAISNSRPGSRRVSIARSKLGTAGSGGVGSQKELPHVPRLPTVRSSVATTTTITAPRSMSYFSESAAEDGTEYWNLTAELGAGRN